ncbi:MAG TPA: SGNH/GDSL hydrolase family protein [Thermoanaerobaculia bacterium]|jgi:lysophospholipase L1-like esterase|nr:SGNH/GDSL hydrolase family protein [Thermoanaerobaculia bacterium]
MKRSQAFLALVATLALLAASAAAAQAFDKYVALGDSLAAGYQSNCLVQRNQIHSAPADLAAAIGITDFEQPLVQEIPLTNPLVGQPCLYPMFMPPASFSIVPVSQMGPPLNVNLPRPYDNLGMPGANVIDLTAVKHGDPTGSGIEQIAALVLRNVTGSPFDGMSAIDEANLNLASSSGAKLLTIGIGNNDVLGAATSGVVIDGVTLTTVADFTAAYQALISAVAPGVMIARSNIPDVTALPFTTTIPPVLVDPTTRQPVVIGGSLVPLLGEGDAAFPCTPAPPDSGCPLPQGSLVLLPASALLAGGTGIPVAAGGNGQPLPHGKFVPPSTVVPGFVLYPDEVALLQDRVNAYNGVIAAADSGPLVDAHAILQDVNAHGYEIGGVTLTSAFLTGGVFAYDGVHLTWAGYAILADYFVLAINAQAGTDIPRVDVASTLFAPNIPPTVASGGVTAGGGGYDYSIWRDTMATAGLLSRGLNVRMPSVVSDPRPLHGPTHTLTRSVD